MVEISGSIDTMFEALQEILQCSLKDMLVINQVADSLCSIQNLANSFQAELKFVSPPYGRFWAVDILEKRGLSLLKTKLQEARKQIEALQKNKDLAIKKCAEQLAIISGLESSLCLLEETLSEVVNR